MNSSFTTRRDTAVARLSRVRHRYRDVIALDDVDVTLAAGEVVGRVSDFEDGLASRFGWGWVASTDDRMGGHSVVQVAVEEDFGGRVLVVEGEVRPGFLFPWAGAMFFPGDPPMTAVDLGDASW